VRSRANLPVFIAYVLIGLLAVAALALQMGGEFVLGGYRVNAIFKTGADLVAGDDVTMSGLRVGKIEALAPIAGATRVSMLLHGDFAPVFRDARAVIRQKNLLGEGPRPRAASRMAAPSTRITPWHPSKSTRC